MSWVVDLESEKWKKDLVGGKAFHLAEMTRWGLRVPAFGVLTTESYEEWVKTKIFSEQTISEVRSSLKEWSQAFYAVRSSMSKEDGTISSFAGIFESYLFVSEQDVLDKVLQCYSSIHSERAAMYLSRLGLTTDGLGVAVVVQCMVDAKVSGVAFSRHPQGHSGLALIEAGLGLGEGVVSGHVEVDRIQVDRFTRVWDYKISNKSLRSLYVKEKKMVEICKVDDADSDQPALSLSQIKTLSEKLFLAEKKLGKAADMEWATDQHGQLFFLQVRPITQDFAALEFYSDTNLAESYPNKVSRLTADFVPRAYEKVIGETLTLLGIAWQHDQGIRQALKGLVSVIDGHFYYHLKNYYSVLFILPGGYENIRAWHSMIGGSAAQIPFYKFDSGNQFRKRLPVIKLFYYWFTHTGLFRKFIENRFNELKEKKDFIGETNSSRQSAQLPMQFFEEIQDWGLTTLNDLFIIVGLKILNKIVEDNGLPTATIADWLKTKEGMDSLDALHNLDQLQSDLGLLKRETAENFWQLLDPLLKKNENWTTIYKALETIILTENINRLKYFLEKYGERCFEELKLESMPFSESPQEFFKILRHRTPSSPSYNRKPVDAAKLSISLLGKLKLNLFLPLTQKAVQARESTRLMRGRFYGLIRLAVLRTADLFIIENQNRFPHLKRTDFFNLNLHELQQYGKGHLSDAKLVEICQSETKFDNNLDYPEHYCAANSESDQIPYFRLSKFKAALKAENTLIGLGVSPGIVSGYALVLTDPRDALSLQDLEARILVTRSTDPAWIFIMSKCRGLVSEKGSLLSHTAIVGRELGIPTVVSVAQATQVFKNGELIEINGQTGEVKRLQT